MAPSPPHPPEKRLPNLLDLSGRTRTALLQRHLVSYQATELCDAILEGYAKSKKQFFVSGSLFLPRSPGFIRGDLIHLSCCSAGGSWDRDG